MQTECLINKKTLEKLKPLGMNVQVLAIDTLPGNITKRVSIRLQHPKMKSKSMELTLQLPVFKGNTIKWRNTKKALLWEATVNIESDMEILFGKRSEEERMDLFLKPPERLLVSGLQDGIADSLRSWYYGKEDVVDPASVQASIDKWFASGEEWRVLKMSRIAQEDQPHGVIIKQGGNEPSHRERMMARVFSSQLHGSLDLNSGSVGDKINESFRIANLAEIQGDRLVPAKDGNPFCKILTKHGIGLGMNARRAYLLRPTMESAIDLVHPEDPLVTPYEDGEENKLHGINFVTAVMHLDMHTHEDSIAISESAARKMMGARTVTQLVESNRPVVPLVSIGDSVYPSSVIALDGEDPVTASKLYCAAKVLDLEVQKGARLGEITNRVWIKYESYYTLETGDKLTNRHGGKGVVTVVPDEDMPVREDGTIVEVCIGPETITNRKCMAILWEMMLTKKADIDLEPVRVKMFNESGPKDWNRDSLHDFKGLALKYGDKEQLSLHGVKLPEQTFVSKLFWMRLDKIAMEIVTVVGKKRRLNNLGGTVDAASISGQRCNVAKLMAMGHRGLNDLAISLIERNMSAKAHFKNLIEAIRNYDHTGSPNEA